MKILVTNDDGIYARGLWVLTEALMEVGEVVVVAPDREQSAVGTSVTLHHPVRATPVVPQVAGVTTYSIEGTPADSVILALGTLVDGEVDLVVSGINEGSNLGNDVLISGTVGAALQGYFRGVPSIAISVTALEDVHFDAAARLATFLAGRFAVKALPKDILLNVNLPNIPFDEIEGIEITQLAGRTYVDLVQEGHDGKRKYYWIVRGKSEWDEAQGTDIWAIRRNRISITPIHANLTAISSLPTLGSICSFLFRDLQEWCRAKPCL